MLFGCNESSVVFYPQHTITLINPDTKKLSELDLKMWYLKDVFKDSIPGISLLKVFDEMKLKSPEEITVAILDTEIDINHEDLKDKIWNNNDEIPDNNIDDDDNGYVDDYNGWNFIGNGEENIIYSNYELIRIIRKYKSRFENRNLADIEESEKEKFNQYRRAKIVYEKELKSAIEDQEHGVFLAENYPKAKRLLKKFFPSEDYSLNQVDSLYSIYKKDEELGTLIYFMSDFLKYELTEKWIYDYKKGADFRVNKLLNINYVDRAILKDDPDNLADTNYGTGNVSGNLEEFYHGTVVAGIIGAVKNNQIGIDGICDNVRIMPVNISSNGEEHDKDIALAIRYAVDNGAKIINMSFAKNFSLREEWVTDAIKYASEKDVLIVQAASNESVDVDLEPIYPKDTNKKGYEFVDNYITVGATTYNLDKNLRSYFSNYGAKNVDIFAPGSDIFTTEVKNSYGYHSGTSVSAAIVTGVCALLRSNYPRLSASETKEILMKSGISYNITIEIPQEDETLELIPFTQLSKSGKVVNAYNALLMAEQISKSKE